MKEEYEQERETPFLYRRIVAIKFDDEIEVPYEAGAEEYLAENYGVPWYELAEALPGITLQPKFTSVSPNELEQLVARAEESDPTYEPPNFFSYFVIVMPPKLNPYELVAALQEWDIVRYAYVESLPTPGPAVTTDDLFFSSQGYIEPHAPSSASPTFGIGASCAWNVTGGDGSGIKFVDIEQGWYPHDDLPLFGPPLVGIDIQDVPDTFIPGTNPTAFRDQQRSHGTNSLGVVVAVDNTIGIVGIAPQATAATASIWHEQVDPNDASQSIYRIDVADTILGTLPNLAYGDVMLIEAQIRCESSTMDCTSDNYEPVELEIANFEAVRLATALGITVVEAAGNGPEDGDALNLDERALHLSSPPEHILNPDSSDFRDSGAILVGAASSFHPHERLIAGTSSCATGDDFLPSNYGERVDCFAWGQCVATTGQAGGAPDGYRFLFNSTSSAAAIVAGAAVVLQGIASGPSGPISAPLSAFALRSLLGDSSFNTESANPTFDRIGVMPDLCRLMSEGLDLAPDVYIRDHIGDTGDPHTGPLAASPDVILRADMVADPDTEFGSATENDVTLGHEAQAGQTNFVYVRVKNRGATATHVKATVYWSPPASLVTPDLWQLVGSIIIPTVPSGDTLVVSAPITWDTVPATGHYCFVGLIGTDLDPAPEPAAFENFDNYRAFIRNNNNVTWRNFNVVDNSAIADPDADAVEANFLITGPPDEPREMSLDFIALLPDRARIWLEGPAEQMLPLLQSTPTETERNGQYIRIHLRPQGTTPLGPALFDAQQQIPVNLWVHIPETRRHLSYNVALRQLYEGREVGRITWRLAPPRTLQ